MDSVGAAAWANTVSDMNSHTMLVSQTYREAIFCDTTDFCG